MPEPGCTAVPLIACMQICRSPVLSPRCPSIFVYYCLHLDSSASPSPNAWHTLLSTDPSSKYAQVSLVLEGNSNAAIKYSGRLVRLEEKPFSLSFRSIVPSTIRLLFSLSMKEARHQRGEGGRGKGLLKERGSHVMRKQEKKRGTRQRRIFVEA